jgi:hypothetical protein
MGPIMAARRKTVTFVGPRVSELLHSATVGFAGQIPIERLPLSRCHGDPKWMMFSEKRCA